MKNNVQAHVKGGKTPQSAQARTRQPNPSNGESANGADLKSGPVVISPYGPEYNLTGDERDAGHPVLCLFDRETQGPVSKVPLSDEEMEHFCRNAAIQLGSTPSDVPGNALTSLVAAEAAKAIREKMQEPILDWRDNLTNAKDEVLALGWLLLESHHQKAGFGDAVQNGIVRLLSSTNARLDKAVEAACAGRPAGEVAS